MRRMQEKRVQTFTNPAGLGLVAFLLAACSSETYEIAPSWSTGDKRSIVFTIDGESEMAISGAPSFSASSRSEIWLDMEITDVDAANAAAMNFTFQRAELNETVNANGVTFVPFAGDEGASPLQRMYAALQDRTFTATVGANGRVTAIEGTTTIVDHLKEAAPATAGIAPGMKLPQEQLDELTKMFAETFDESATTGLLEMVFNIYPGRAVSVGDSWTTRTMGAFGEFGVELITTWTLEGVESGLLHLSFQLKFDQPSGEFGESNSGSGSGTATIDSATGLLTGLNATINNVMENKADGASVRDEGSQTVTIEVF